MLCSKPSQSVVPCVVRTHVSHGRTWSSSELRRRVLVEERRVRSDSSGTGLRLSDHFFRVAAVPVLATHNYTVGALTPVVLFSSCCCLYSRERSLKSGSIVAHLASPRICMSAGARRIASPGPAVTTIGATQTNNPVRAVNNYAEKCMKVKLSLWISKNKAAGMLPAA